MTLFLLGYAHLNSYRGGLEEGLAKNAEVLRDLAYSDRSEFLKSAMKTVTKNMSDSCRNILG